MTLPTLGAAGLPALSPGRDRLPAVILIVAGVAGSGKSTVGALIAGRLHWQFADADAFHPEANVAKMRAGIPLTDADRQPWLHAVGYWIDTQAASGQSGRDHLLGAQARLPRRAAYRAGRRHDGLPPG